MSFLSKIPFANHLGIALILRICLIMYGEIQDKNSEVPYTDVDYKVVTDGARHIIKNESPFNRHTYRYSPIIAYLMLPNILVHKAFGKLLFAVFDVIIGLLIERIVYHEMKSIFFETAESLMIKHNRLPYRQKFFLPDRYVRWAKWSALVWLYNPIGMVISTRGNSDSFSSFFVLATLYFTQKFQSSNFDIFCAGLCHGLAIHLRIYPLIFSLALYFSLSERKLEKYGDFIKTILLPNEKQLILVIGTIFSLGVFTFGFYINFGEKYIQEAYLYHLLRKDTRHNFSLYFLLQYLGSGTEYKSSIIEKLFISFPQILLLIYISFSFGKSRRTLSFCIFMQTFLMVTYNSVVTSQYFVWYMVLLPLCLKNLRNIPIKLIITYFILWLLGQGLWLLPAYLLEFKTINTFNFIGIQSVVFFFINIFILQRFIKYYDIFSRVKIIEIK